MKLSPDTRDRMLDILDYWHKIEFFVPFDLDAKIAECKEWQIHWVHSDALADENWSLWKPNVPETHVFTSYSLFLGIFDKAESVRVCREVVAASGTSIDESQNAEWNGVEDAERADLEGSTCFARLKLSEDGVPCFEGLSISTLPWALGQTKEGGLSSLKYDIFETAKGQLGDLLANFQSEYKLSEKSSRWPIASSQITGLHRLLCEWAKYTPAEDGRVGVLVADAEQKPSAMQEEGIKPNKAIASQVGSEAQSRVVPGTSKKEEQDKTKNRLSEKSIF